MTPIFTKFSHPHLQITCVIGATKFGMCNHYTWTPFIYVKWVHPNNPLEFSYYGLVYGFDDWIMWALTLRYVLFPQTLIHCEVLGHWARASSKSLIWWAALKINHLVKKQPQVGYPNCSNAWPLFSMSMLLDLFLNHIVDQGWILRFFFIGPSIVVYMSRPKCGHVGVVAPIKTGALPKLKWRFYICSL